MSEVVKKLRLSIVLIVLLIASGTVGFAMLGRDWFHAFYLTIVILTTVGMEGAKTDPERAFSLYLMVIGVGVVLYATGIVVASFVDGRIRELLGSRHQMQKINQTRDHFIIAGFGRMGRATCMLLEHRCVPFVLIESDEKRVEHAQSLGYLCILGDAVSEQTMMQAGIDRAKGLAACLPKDADNVYIVITARGMNPNLHIISREEEVSGEARMRRAGADRVVCPPLIGASRVTEFLLNPQVEEMLELDGHWPDLELTKISLTRFPRVVGHKLGELFKLIGIEVIVVAIVSADGTRRFNPTPDVVLTDDDQLVVVGPDGSVEQMIGSLQTAQAA